ncbi:MAG: hypothetical protein BWX83_01197 [Candidatus Cloacimonetes bacterium ADurb.Bin117]|nr:MAG: hypothetical protein BWX83_01197 [Candidatus Cloacimonetes bacterium ADurb.Bin117]
MVVGRISVSWGVLSIGVLSPKAPIEEGKNTAAPISLATSSEFIMLSMFIFQARVGLFSPTADSTATRLMMVSMLYLFTTSNIFSASRASMFSQGPPSMISGMRGVLR